MSDSGKVHPEKVDPEKRDIERNLEYFGATRDPEVPDLWRLHGHLFLIHKKNGRWELSEL